MVIHERTRDDAAVYITIHGGDADGLDTLVGIVANSLRVCGLSARTEMVGANNGRAGAFHLASLAQSLEYPPGGGPKGIVVSAAVVHREPPVSHNP
jgi:hypothetical protein